jgi:hypothetical protein
MYTDQAAEIFPAALLRQRQDPLTNELIPVRTEFTNALEFFARCRGME